MEYIREGCLENGMYARHVVRRTGLDPLGINITVGHSPLAEQNAEIWPSTDCSARTLWPTVLSH